MKAAFYLAIICSLLVVAYADTHCLGTPGSCTELTDSTECHGLLGCTWYPHFDYCSGTAYKCDQFLAADTCGQQGDCYWDAGSHSGGDSIFSHISGVGIAVTLIMLCCILPIVVIAGVGAVAGLGALGAFVIYNKSQAAAAGTYTEL
ncbi:hypothetical protein J8273_3689 [Carpediemonas membranifera]|uniref:Uncharacterized protein n=1 Tax=Carpediemonas membranifera TaxID=201153 RepID=A0A8J6BYP2_9EUKA|nr:hypothetical protein J8273_3689 [Carpediemonas membranifera]|eukprot:KAG9394716.1 hypothetical protein J8273_3689 [Carpediemonas membranifera]